MLEYLKDDLEYIFGNTQQYWEALRDKTIFITGGTGFFGVWLQMSFVFINRKLNLNANVIILTRDKAKFLQKNPWLKEYSELSFLEGNISTFNFVEGNVDYIIHAATEASVKLNLENPLTMFDTIVNGTKRILDFAKLKKVKSFLLTSSGAVYGKQPSDLRALTEDYIGAPVSNESSSVYGEGKRMAEVLCSVYYEHFQIPIKIARCYAFIGPYLPLDSHFAAGNFIKNVLNKEDIIIEGDGTPFRSYMYASDLMVWLWTILFAGENNRPYNVGSDIAVSISSFADLVLEVADIKDIRVHVKSPLSGIPSLRYVPNVDRAINELGLHVQCDLKESIKKTIAFNKHNSFNKS